MTLISAYEIKASARPKVISRCGRQQGFTLLELLLVLGILGMAAMLLGPGLATLDSPGFNAQTREATGLLNYARRMAIVQGTPAAIEFSAAPVDEGSARASRNNDDSDASAQQADIVGRWVGDSIALDYRDSAGQDEPVTNRILITFFPEGGSTGGELIMTQGNRRLTISVDPFSGRVRVLDED